MTGLDELGAEVIVGFDYMNLLKGAAGALQGAGGMMSGGGGAGGGSAVPTTTAAATAAAAAETARLQAEKAAAERSANTMKAVLIGLAVAAGVGGVAALAFRR